MTASSPSTPFGIAGNRSLSGGIPIDKQTGDHGPAVPVATPRRGTEVLLLDDDGQRVGCTMQVGDDRQVKSRHFLLATGGSRDAHGGRNFSPTQKIPAHVSIVRAIWAACYPDGCPLPPGPRKDFQVKIRGHRVEIAEVEQALACSRRGEGGAPLSVGRISPATNACRLSRRERHASAHGHRAATRPRGETARRQVIPHGVRRVLDASH